MPQYPAMRTTLAIILALTFFAEAFAQTGPPKADDMDFDELIAHGRRLLKAESFSQGEELFRRALKMKPRSAIAHNELGVALFQQDAVEVAVKSFQEALKIDLKMTHALANLGEAHRRAKQYKDGALAFHKLLGLSKKDPYGLLGLGLCFEGYYQLQKSLQTLKIAAKNAGDFKPLLGRIRRSIKRVRIKLKEAKLPILQRVDAMILAGQLEEAQSLLDCGIKSKDKKPALFGRRGLVRAIRGNLDGSREDLETALLGDPSDAVAAGTYVMVLDVLLADQVAQLNGARAGVLLVEDRAALAYKAFNLAARDGDSDSTFARGRGESALRMGLYEEAQEDLAGKTPSDAAAMAEAALLQGLADDAGKHLKQANSPYTLADLPTWRRSLLMN